MTLGGYNLTKYAEDENSTITWNELTNTNYWSLNLVSVKLGDRDLPISSNYAIADTGTSYLLMPTCKIMLFITFSEDFEHFKNYFS